MNRSMLYSNQKQINQQQQTNKQKNQLNCSFCRSKLQNQFFICTQCKTFLCIDCALAQVQVRTHKNTHKLIFVDLKSDHQELLGEHSQSQIILFTTLICIYGYGSLDLVQEFLKTNYNLKYMQILQHLFMSDQGAANNIKGFSQLKFISDITLNDQDKYRQKYQFHFDQDYIKRYQFLDGNCKQYVSGSWPLRQDFSVEYINKAEYPLSSLHFTFQETEKQFKIKLQLLHIYVYRLLKRLQMKQLISQYELNKLDVSQYPICVNKVINDDLYSQPFIRCFKCKEDYIRYTNMIFREKQQRDIVYRLQCKMLENPYGIVNNIVKLQGKNSFSIQQHKNIYQSILEDMQSEQSQTYIFKQRLTCSNLQKTCKNLTDKQLVEKIISNFSNSGEFGQQFTTLIQLCIKNNYEYRKFLLHILDIQQNQNQDYSTYKYYFTKIYGKIYQYSLQYYNKLNFQQLYMIFNEQLQNTKHYFKLLELNQPKTIELNVFISENIQYLVNFIIDINKEIQLCQTCQNIFNYLYDILSIFESYYSNTYNQYTDYLQYMLTSLIHYSFQMKRHQGNKIQIKQPYYKQLYDIFLTQKLSNQQFMMKQQYLSQLQTDVKFIKQICIYDIYYGFKQIKQNKQYNSVSHQVLKKFYQLLSKKQFLSQFQFYDIKQKLCELDVYLFLLSNISIPYIRLFKSGSNSKTYQTYAVRAFFKLVQQLYQISEKNNLLIKDKQELYNYLQKLSDLHFITQDQIQLNYQYLQDYL